MNSTISNDTVTYTGHNKKYIADWVIERDTDAVFSEKIDGLHIESQGFEILARPGYEIRYFSDRSPKFETQFPVRDAFSLQKEAKPDFSYKEQTWDGSQHYKDLDIEPWDAMESWASPEEFYGFLKLSALKRIARAKTKAEEIKDITKAIHELQKAFAIATKYELFDKYPDDIDYAKMLSQASSMQKLEDIAHDAKNELGSLAWAMEYMKQGEFMEHKGKLYNAICYNENEFEKGHEPIYAIRNMQSCIVFYYPGIANKDFCSGWAHPIGRG